MGEFWRRVGVAMSRHAAATMVAVVGVTAILALGLGKLDFATGQDSYLDPASTVAENNRQYQALFGGENMVVLLTVPEGQTVATLMNPTNSAALQQLVEQIRRSPAVQTVISPASALAWTDSLIRSGTASTILTRTAERDTDPASKDKRAADLAMTAARLGAAGAQEMTNPAWVDFLLFANDGFTLGADGKPLAPSADHLVVRKSLRSFIPDSRHAIVAAVLTGNAPLDRLKDGSEAVKAALRNAPFEGVETIATGTPTFLTDINDYLQGGMLTLGGIAVLVMLVILLIAFKVRWRLLPLLGMVVGVIWGFGLFGLFGTALSLVTIAGLPILIGMGIEFAIQVQNRIEEERTLGQTERKRRTLNLFGETLAQLGPSLLTATVAAVIAFLTVRISRVPMVQDFGLLLSLGIVALLVAGIVIPVAVIGARERRRPRKDPPQLGWVERTVAFLGGAPRWTVLPLVVIAIVIPIVGLAMEGGSRIESDPIKWANQGSTSIRNAHTLEREVGMSSTLGVFLRTSSATSDGVFTDQMGAFVTDFVNGALADEPMLAKASSLATTVAWLTEVPGATTLAPTGLDMLEAYQQAPQEIQTSLVAEAGNSAQVLFYVGPSSLEQRAGLLDRLDARVVSPGTKAPLPARSSATTGGLAVVGVGLLDNISANRAELTIVALLLVGAFVMLRYRDLARGLLTMVPVLLAVGASAVLVRVLGITLSPLTTVGGPLVVATCAEFAILLVDRYAEERERGQSPALSNRVAAERTGRAFFTSALTTLGGFAVLMFSSLPLLSDFGMVVTINIAVALLAALVVVPPLAKEADRLALLAVGHHDTPGRGLTLTGKQSQRRTLTGVIAGALLAAAGLVLVVRATDHDEPPAPVAQQASEIEAPATLPPSTTAAPTTTADPNASTTTLAAAATLPPGPAEKPAGLVAGTFYDALTGKGGVAPGVARCAADELISTTPEAQLLEMGIAQNPRPDAVNQLLTAAATRCGVSPEQLQAAAG